MAGLKLGFGWKDVTLTVNDWKTVGSVKAGADQHVKIVRVRLGTGGVDGSAKPLDFRLQPVTASSGTGTAVTPSKISRAFATTARSVCRVNFSAEPTATANSAIGDDKFHAQGGEYQDWTFEDVLTEAGGEIAVQVSTPSGEVAVVCSGHVVFEE